MVVDLKDADRRRAQHFAGVAAAVLGPLCEKMQLTLGEAQVGYTLLLAECLSHYATADRQAICAQLATWLPELAEEIECKRQGQSRT